MTKQAHEDVARARRGPRLSSPDLRAASLTQPEDSAALFPSRAVLAILNFPKRGTMGVFSAESI